MASAVHSPAQPCPQERPQECTAARDLQQQGTSPHLCHPQPAAIPLVRPMPWPGLASHLCFGFYNSLSAPEETPARPASGCTKVAGEHILLVPTLARNHPSQMLPATAESPEGIPPALHGTEQAADMIKWMDGERIDCSCPCCKLQAAAPAWQKNAWAHEPAITEPWREGGRVTTSGPTMHRTQRLPSRASIQQLFSRVLHKEGSCNPSHHHCDGG